MKKYDVTALGEILIDYTPQGKTEAGYPIYIQNPGGAPMNMAAAVKKLGEKGSAAFIGKVGDDAQGKFLINCVNSCGVDISGIVSDKTRNTTLAFVTLYDDGNRDFTFYRDTQADVNLSPDEIDYSIIADSKVFHFGSLSMTHEPARSATLAALKYAKEAGCLISFDPNYRSALQTEKLFIDSVDAIIADIDILKISEDEARLYTGLYEIADCADAIMKKGTNLKLLAITLGADGSYVKSRNYSFSNEAYKDNIVTIDTTGAGDIFWGSFVSALIDCGMKFESEEEMKKAFRFASVSAGLSTTKKGGAPSIAEKSEILSRI